MLLQESTPSEYQRVFTEIEQNRPDAIIVDGRPELTAFHQLIVELVNKSRLPAIYPYRDYVDAGLMAYEADLGEAGRRAADDVHPDPERCETGRHSDLSTDQIRIRDQFES